MIILPQKFEEILNKDTTNYYKGAVYSTCHKFDQIFSENRLYFFEEFTDHGIRHINSVLDACANLITPDTYKLLTEKDISILVLSVFLHDLGMHLQPLTFKKMVTGGYDDVLNTDFGDQKWSVLWENYLFEAKKFNDQQRINIFGDAGVEVSVPDLNNPDSLTGVHRKLIGEFIRRHHPRIAFEVAFKGLATNEGTQIDFCAEFDYKHKLLAGLLARSHGMNIRDTFPILEKHFTKRVWRRPINVHIIYLMALLRLADYFQIDILRVLKVPYLTRLFKSPVSFDEHQKHLQTTFIQETDDDPETLYITTEPSNSTYFLALERLFNDIQKEIDNSWAVLGEVYGSKSYDEQPKLAYRRIRSNIDDKKEFEATVNYVPEGISFTVDREIPKLLVGPLYHSNPTFGVRELLQNAVDACWEREFFEKDASIKYEPSIVVKIKPFKDQYLLSISDNGKGMTLDEIKNYFLKVGGSFRKSVKWQSDHLDEKGHSNINKIGRFGIGVLAAYLLGTEIEVHTRSFFSAEGYIFKTALDQEQVEIIKDNNLNIGTVISIVISSKTFDELVSNDNTVNKRLRFDPMRFDNWFVLNTPSIKYEVPNSAIIRDELNEEGDYYPAVNENNDFWHEITHPEFKKIIWSYLDGLEETIISNGFVVPGNCDLENDLLRAPTIMVFDYDAKLPINLNRTLVNCPLPFDEQLETQICKDGIAMFLINEVGNIYSSHCLSPENFYIYHPAFAPGFLGEPVSHLMFNDSQLILSREGFFINHYSVIEKILGLNFLKILMLESQDGINTKLNQKYLFNSLDVDLISVGSFVKDINYDNIRIRRLVREHFLKNRNKEMIGWTDDFNVAGSKRSTVKHKPSKNIQKELLLKNATGISCVYFKYKKASYNQDIFGKVLSDLLGDDLLIPYAIEDRKKKFPKAFKELEPYMRKYLKDK